MWGGGGPGLSGRFFQVDHLHLLHTALSDSNSFFYEVKQTMNFMCPAMHVLWHTLGVTIWISFVEPSHAIMT